MTPPCVVGYLEAARRAGVGELADHLAASAGPLIAHDGRPVLILSDGQGNQLVSPTAWRTRSPRIACATR